jgi:stalled ribosome rescue protein Dom34
MLVSCSSLFSSKNDVVEKYKVDNEAVKNWDETISETIKGEALIEDWYGGEEPIFYLRKSGIMNEKEYKFLASLKKKEVISQEDEEEFNSLLKKYSKKIEREFWIKDENLKDPKGLAEKMVKEANLRIKNPSNYILSNVATGKEKELLKEYAGKKDLTEKETKNLRKLLNSFIKREEFFVAENWYNREVSNRLMEIVEISKKDKISKLERNNINAKALYIAYPEYFSELEKWND